jgi:MoaA/NifB/PqqE/SkfB family radical SAM enzyme
MKLTMGSHKKTLPLSQRGEIRLGFRCNARCGFCYYQELLDNPVEREPTSEALREKLAALRALGASEVEFTGGEPTIRPDLSSLVEFAVELGFTNISIITNGLRISNPAYAARLQKAGINDVLFSIHGHTAELHDQHTKIPGSFAKILKAYTNMRDLGVRCRTSTTVTGLNYGYTEEIFDLVLSLGAACMHFAVFSPVGDAQGTDTHLFVDYTDAATSIKRAIDRFEKRLPPLSVKYIPFCFMQGYEQYVMNLYQQSYDPDDWNYYYSNRVRRADSLLKRLLFDMVCLIGLLSAKEFFVPFSYGLLGMKVAGLTRIAELLRKKRLKTCRNCRYDRVCDYAWKGYLKQFGESGFVSVPGDKIRHPAWSYVMSFTRNPGDKVGNETLQQTSSQPSNHG